MDGIRRRMSKFAVGAWVLGALLYSTASAQTLPELFQKLKNEVHARSWNEASRTLAALQAEAVKPGNEESLKKLEGPIAFYRGVCEANLGHTHEAVEDFVTFLKIQPHSTIDPTAYSREAVAAFEDAQKIAVDRPPSISAAYNEFVPPADRREMDPADKYWADGPVKWILTDEESAEWSRLTDPNARVDFVERFWAARVALPGVEGRTYREEFERRVAFADTYLAHDAETRGSLTDRGMVFVLLGPPTNARRRALRSAEDPSEPSGMSRVETQEGKIASKGGGLKVGAKGGTGGAALSWARYLAPENRALPTDDEYIEIWNYADELLPRGVSFRQVDVHYVTKRGGGKNVLQPSTTTRAALATAKRAAAPARRG